MLVVRALDAMRGTSEAGDMFCRGVGIHRSRPGFLTTDNRLSEFISHFVAAKSPI